MKLTRTRLGKEKIISWEKMKKHMRSTFLPYNFQRLMYQRLQNLRQGLRSVDEYTTEFYQLIARNEIQETEDQLVSHYIGGLNFQIQNTVNMFDPVSVSAAHQRALVVEKQMKRRPNTVSTGSGAGSSSSSGVQKAAASSGNIGQFNRTSGMKCFGYGETAHRKFECKKTAAKTLFVDADDYEEDCLELEGEPVYDKEESADKVHLEGDVGTVLVVRHSCFTLKASAEEHWL